MRICRSYAELKQAIDSIGDKFAFVPTMGALHEGHLSLVEYAKKYANYVVVSIFVNPTQFAAHEDLDAYPRPESKDLDLLNSLGVDIVYFPQQSEIYPNSFNTYVLPGKLAESMEGQFRPHFFKGVLTVVLVLIQQVRPAACVFGEKDYQQLLLVRQMVKDFYLNVDIIGAPIIRSSHSELALSSRNKYLSSSDILVAEHFALIFKSVTERLSACDLLLEEYNSIIEQGRAQLFNIGVEAIDYLDIRDENSLTLINGDLGTKFKLRLFIAVRIAGVRLLDNRALHSS